jgi:hypothetical protein
MHVLLSMFIALKAWEWKEKEGGGGGDREREGRKEGRRYLPEVFASVLHGPLSCNKPDDLSGGENVHL